MKTYSKPLVTSVALRPSEAVLSGCKVGMDVKEAACLSLVPGIQYGCNFPGSGGQACYTRPGS
jgi:hypothetical protein